jgi:hypothetical protein
MRMASAEEDDKKPALSPLTLALLSLLQGLLPAMTAIVGGLWVAFTYLNQQAEAQRLQIEQRDKDRTAHLFEASKPYFEKQLALFVETSHILGKLTSSKPDTKEWVDADNRLKEIQRGEAVLVGGSEYVSQMEAIVSELTQYAAKPEEEKRMKLIARSQSIGEAMRTELLYGWNWRGEDRAGAVKFRNGIPML